MVDHTAAERRRVLGLLAGTLTAAAGVRTEAADEPVEVVDVHTHFYDPTRAAGVPWPGKDDPLLYKPRFPADLRREAADAPVKPTATIVVEASPWLEDNQWLLDLAARDPFVVGVVGNLSPAGAGFAEHLRRFAAAPKYRGFRVNQAELHRGLTDEKYVADLAATADAGLSLDVNGGPDLLADVAVLAKRLPKLRIVVNHLANVGNPDGGPADPAWAAGMRQAAKSPNVFCKASALVEATGRSMRNAPTAVDFYRPILDVAWNAFGADRLLFASNWPVSERFASYAVLAGVVKTYWAEKGPTASRRFFGTNHRAAYGP
ncbi:MAG: amidohydrolase family protein [Planctomycetia bacterium]